MSRLSIASLLLFASTVVAQPPAKFALSADETKILQLANEARTKENLGPLTASPLLTEIARAHSKNQAKQDKMAHELDGKNPGDRIKAAGYAFRAYGENVAYGQNVTLENIFEGWMKSPPHRANILKSDFTEIGIGVAGNDAKKIYYTQVFGRPK